MNTLSTNPLSAGARLFYFLGLLAAIEPTFAAPAQPDTLALTNKKYSSPSLVPIKDVPGLPRVLLIGDSISMGYTLPTRAALAGKANVHRPPTNCGSTLSGLKNLGDWLGTNHWDVIHFNWGMHDLKYFQSNGKQNVLLTEYEKNLRTLVAQLQKTGATLIFATTTPIPEKTPEKIFFRHQEDVEKYNQAAEKVMKENGIMIDDLYSVALPIMSEIQVPNNVHQTRHGSEILSRKVAASILDALEKHAAQNKKQSDTTSAPKSKN